MIINKIKIKPDLATSIYDKLSVFMMSPLHQ